MGFLTAFDRKAGRLQVSDTEVGGNLLIQAHQSKLLELGMMNMSWPLVDRGRSQHGNHDTSTCLALFGFTPAARDTKEQKHECKLLGATKVGRDCSIAIYMMLPIEREFMCQLALPWGTRHLISPEVAG